MTPKDMRLTRKTGIEERLRKKYKTTVIHDEICFIKEDGTVFHVDMIGGQYNSLVIEFAASIEEATACFPDDGRLYYMDEMNEDEMFAAMVEEIEGERRE